MKPFAHVALLTVLISATYTGIAWMLPQIESHPPPLVELGQQVGPAVLAQAGAQVFAASCVQCHILGDPSARCPDLSSVGASAPQRAAARAAETQQDYTDVDYLIESLCQPSAHLVEGYDDIMPPQGRALSGGQLLALVAFLQDQGAEASVVGTESGPIARFGCDQAPPAPRVRTPEALFQAHGCASCHDIHGDARLVGPALSKVGARLDRAALIEALLDPDASLAPGDPPYPPGLMRPTLEANGFYSQVTSAELLALVDWLAAKQGQP